MWTNPCKVLALLGGALVLAGPPFGERPVMGGGSRPSTWVAPVFLGIFLLVCGVQHYVYSGFVDTLVPAWIPPSARFWTYFTGTALILGGAGLLLRRTAAWAALASGVMIFLWILLLHIPRAVAAPADHGETSAIFEALALSGVCLLIAGMRAPVRR